MAAGKRRTWLRLALLLAVTLGAGEVAVRISDRVRGTDSSLPPLPDVSKVSMMPHPYIGYIPRPGYTAPATGPDGSPRSYTQNSMGFRGPEFQLRKAPRTFRVACIGGSTTQGTNKQGDDETWPARLGALLNARLTPDSPYDHVEVLNAGAAFYTSMESFVNLKTRLLSLDLDLVIDYDAVNDTQIISRAGFRPDYTHARRSWTPPPPRSLPDELLGWSHLYGFFLSPEHRLAGRRIADYVLVDGFLEMPRVAIEEMGPGFETFYWTLREIVAVAREHGVPTMLCTFAWPRTGKYAQSGAADASIDSPAIIGRLNEIIRAVAALQDAPLADLEKTGPSTSAQFDDPIHPNAVGYDLIARQMAKVVVETGLLSRPPARPELPEAVRKASAPEGAR